MSCRMVATRSPARRASRPTRFSSAGAQLADANSGVESGRIVPTGKRPNGARTVVVPKTPRRDDCSNTRRKSWRPRCFGLARLAEFFMDMPSYPPREALRVATFARAVGNGKQASNSPMAVLNLKSPSPLSAAGSASLSGWRDNLTGFKRAWQRLAGGTAGATRRRQIVGSQQRRVIGLLPVQAGVRACRNRRRGRPTRTNCRTGPG